MNQKLSILHLNREVTLKSGGGLAPTVLELTRAQHTLGHEATIWCLEKPQVASEVAKEYSLSGNIITFPTIGPRALGYSLAMERKAISSNGERFDIIHRHSLWEAISRVPIRWRARFKKPTVVSPHGTLEDFALRRSAWKKWLASRFYEAKNLRDATCLHATSPTEVTSFRKWGLTNPIAIIPPGVPDAWIESKGAGGEFRQRFSLPKDKRIILFLSRLHPKKGLPMLFNAIANAKDHLRDWILVVAGPNELNHMQELQLLAQRQGIVDFIRFVGPVFDIDKRNAFAAADLFILPTQSDNFAIAVAEALGAGVPVITTYGAPWAELQTHDCGWWVPIGAGHLETALFEATRLPQLELEARGKRGRRLVQEKYTWNECAVKTIELYCWLINGGKPPEFVVTA
jgi:glycosyltransferase involved in cell wall biosynthesis